MLTNKVFGLIAVSLVSITISSITHAQIAVGEVMCACPGLSKPLGTAANCEDACYGRRSSGGSSTNVAASELGTAIGQMLGQAIGQWLRGNPERKAELQRQMLALEERRQEAARLRAETERLRREEMFGRLNAMLKLAGLPALYLKNIDNSQELGLKGLVQTPSGLGELKLKLGDDSTNGYGIPGLPGIYTDGPRATRFSLGGSSTNEKTDTPLALKLGDEGTKPAITKENPEGVGSPSSDGTFGIPGLPGIYLNGSQQPTVGIQQAKQLSLSAEKLSGPERELVEAAALDAAMSDPAIISSSDEKVASLKKANEQYEQASEVQTQASKVYDEAQKQQEAASEVLKVAEAQFEKEKAAGLDPAAFASRQQDFNQMVASAKTDEEAWKIAKEQFEKATADLTVKRGATLQALEEVSVVQPVDFAPAAVIALAESNTNLQREISLPVVGTCLPGSKLVNGQCVIATESNPAFSYLFALQDRTLTPLADGGHPIDTPESTQKGLHGLVGGTTWTYGFKWPQVKCDQDCKDHINLELDVQLALYCSSQGNPKQCLAEGLPFSPDMYDMVVSMGSAHTFIEDFATRVFFDHGSFGEFSRQNKEIFASLKGREFDTLDCHSNGALVCLAALRSGDTTAKEVRLFGPQMSPEAAKLWQEYAANTNTTIKIFINQGDPVPAISWKLPTPQTPIEKAATVAWFSNPVTAPAALADALFNTYFDTKTGVMDATLRAYGFEVTRNLNLELLKCKDFPSIDCHSMKIYELSLPEKKANSISK